MKKINGDFIFGEIEDVTELFNDWEELERNPELHNIYRELCLKEVDGEEMTEEEREEAAFEVELMTVKRFSFDGVLYQALLAYYGNYKEMMKGIRSAVSHDNYIYYVTGVGYDTISCDLLNGKADGTARKKFADSVNIEFNF